MSDRFGSIRVSFAAILRIRVDERFVLFHTPSRPGTFSPPGGVYKYFWPAEQLLEKMGFREDRIDAFAGIMKFDLRGFVPAAAMRDFRRWFASGAYREDTAECLRRELGEELKETGLDHLVPGTHQLAFSPVRTIWAGPHPVLGFAYRQLRRIDVCDLVMSDPAAQQLRGELIRAARDDAVPTVISVTADDVRYGRSGAALIAAQTAYLVGSERIRPDIPAIR